MDAQYSVAYNTLGAGSAQVRTASLIRWDSIPKIVASVAVTGGTSPSTTATAWLQDVAIEDVGTLTAFLTSAAPVAGIAFDAGSNTKVMTLLPTLTVAITVQNGKNSVRVKDWVSASKLLSGSMVLDSTDVTAKFVP